ncbi:MULTISPECIES: hypothetical protein [unclassified Variovorax]|uniref:hypothetical protein n=1 Tax=unclassified Variovorax TaxID=663243 RepID=UPI001BD24A44|nr:MULTISPECIES: hypothetical protein [unclassified Variovorax]
MNDNDRALCATTASLLHAAGGIAALGLALSGIALGVLALTARSLSLTSCMGFGAVAIIGVLERYLALRLRLDAGLFEGLARGNIASLSALDSALGRIGVRQLPDASRALAERVFGTRQLLQRHGITVACQAAMFLLALLTQDMQ